MSKKGLLMQFQTQSMQRKKTQTIYVSFLVQTNCYQLSQNLPQTTNKKHYQNHERTQEQNHPKA